MYFDLIWNGANLSFIPETLACCVHFLEHEESLLPTISIRVLVATVAVSCTLKSYFRG